jgi:hypothetical protein
LNNSDNNSAKLALLLLALLTAFILATFGPKKHFTSTRIKAIYILENKKSLEQIRETIEVLKIALY